MIALGKNNTLRLSDLTHITIPVTISIGDDDNMVTMSETKDVSHNLKNGHLIIFSDTLHPIEKVDVEKLRIEFKQFFN